MGKLKKKINQREEKNDPARSLQYGAQRKSAHTVEVQTTEVHKVKHIAAIKINIPNVNRIYFNDL